MLSWPAGRLTARAIRLPGALACVLVVALGATACSSSGRHAGATATAPGASHPAAAQGSSGAAPGTLPGMTWSRTADPALALGGGPSTTIAALVAPAAAGQPWLVAGSQVDADGTSTAMVWTSSDAIHWSGSALPGPGPSQARAASAWSGGEVVVGASGTGSGQQAAVWVSSGPGRPLQRVTDPAAFGTSPAPPGGPGRVDASQGAVMTHVAAGALGIFASGTVGGRTALWYSTNGTRWSRVSGAEKVIDANSGAAVNSLVVAQNGVWAAGSVSNGGATDAAVWTSADGIHWTPMAAGKRPFHGDGDHVIEDLLAYGTGFVAVGAVRTGAVWMPASWISPDGASWSQPSESFPMAVRPGGEGGGARAEAVAGQAGQPLVAVGGSVADPRVWSSSDGLSWTETSLPTTAAQATGWRLDLVATSGTTTVVADDTLGAPRLLTDVAGSWTEVTADPATFGTPAVEVQPSALLVDGTTAYLSVNERFPGQTLGSATWSAAVLSSTDGRTWKVDINGGPFAGHQIADLLAAPSGLVAVGSGGGPGAPTAAMWSSPDGVNWTPTYAGAIGQQATAVTRLGSSILAVGQGPGGPANSPTGPDDQAVGWVGSPAGQWQPVGSLDASPGLGEEQPAGACAGPQTAVVVGRGTTGSPGWQALAWTSSNGRSWKAASVSPAPAAGEEEVMEGCLTTGNGFLAFGGSGTAGTTADPALWSASSGSSWTRQAVKAFTGTGGGAITSVAVRGTNWVAVSGASAWASGDQGGGSPPPAALAAATPTAATATSAVALWRSADAGATWQAVPATGTPWTGDLAASASQAAWLGPTALVAGTLDGRLAVWTGVTGS